MREIVIQPIRHVDLSELRTTVSPICGLPPVSRLFEQFASRMYLTVGTWTELPQDRAVGEAAERFLIPDRLDCLPLEPRGTHGDVDAAIDNAAISGDLVLVERPRTIFWEGVPIEVVWSTRNVLWNYLSILIRQAKAGKPTDLTNFCELTYCMALKHWKSRLRKEPGFPSSLGDRITTVKGQHWLNVPPESIHIFEAALDLAE